MLAYIDTIYAGLVPCKVLSVDGYKVTVKVTAYRRGWPKGDVTTEGANVIVPRKNVKRSKKRLGGYTISGDWNWSELLAN